MKPATVLQPAYFEKFRCIGSQCEDTCCVGWIIHIDRNTYGKYQDCADPEYRSPLRTLIQINDRSSSDDDYARIVLNNGGCPFLSDGMCSIQQRLGEGYLSNMCATYPRIIHTAGDTLRRSLDLSCPEAARIVLLDPRPMGFQQQEYQHGAVRPAHVPSLDTSSLQGFPEPIRFLGEVQRLVFSVLQDRSYPVWMRLFLLGCLCERLGELLRNRMGEGSLNAIQEYADRLRGGLLGDLLARCPAAPAIQLESVLELIVARISSDSNPRRFLDCYREFMSGLEWTAQSTMEEIGSRYREAYRKHYCPFMSRHESILEQYLMNYAYRTLFPFGVPESNARLGKDRVLEPMMAQYMLLVACYAITQTLLIGNAGFHKAAFGVDQVIRLIQASTKTFEHSLTFPARVIEMLSAKNMTGAASLCVLIRT